MSKYPEQLTYSNLAATFENRHSKNPKDENSFLKRSIKSRFPATIDPRKVLQEKIQYYNVHVPKKNDAKFDINEDCLGEIPEDLYSVADLLVFNTSYNPYKSYTTFDAQSKVRSRVHIADDTLDFGGVDDQGPGAAPATIMLKELTEKQQFDEYAYTPNLGAVPDFDLPSFLPNLPDIADEQFQADDLPSIAPSALATVSVLPDLPETPSFTTDSIFSPRPEPLVPPPPPPGPPVAANAPPPPPPPPAPFGPGVPPPPPPPPIIQSDPNRSAGHSKAGGERDRSDLLAEIRNAGGSEKFKFRSSVEQRKREKKLRREEEKESGLDPKGAAGGPTGDWMAELNKALALRRKGISGKGDEERERSPKRGSLGGALETISKMIPPPKKQTSVESKSSDANEEWEDED